MAAVVAAAILVAGCSSGGGKTSAPTTTGGPRVTVTTTPFRTVPVSSVCRAAVDLLINHGGGLDPFVGGAPSGIAAEGYEMTVNNTLIRCGSGAEWLTAVRNAGPTRSRLTTDAILERDCGDRFTENPHRLPVNAPSCSSVSDPRAISGIGRCPAAPPARLAVSNNGVHGLDIALVPFPARFVRVCEYTARGLHAGSARFDDPTAAQVATTMNRLHEVALDYAPPCPMTSLPIVFLTFAGDSQRVNAMIQGCGIVSNGARSAQGNAKWLVELQRDAARSRRGSTH